jgi:5'-nucleotidase
LGEIEIFSDETGPDLTITEDYQVSANAAPAFWLGGPPGRHAVLMVSSGDNFLAGPEFNASLQKGIPFYDAIAMDLIGYNAVALGNHEFDFGPDVLADFIEGFRLPVRFLSANLGFSAEPRLQSLVEGKRIAKSIVVVRHRHKIGIIGATTPNLRFISSPRNVQIMEDVAGAVQAEVDALEAKGVNKIILISHLQDVDGDIALAEMLDGVDIMVAGGGDELLANEGDLLIPGDEPFGAYPLTAVDRDGTEIPVVTTSGSYGYVGRLIIGFDKKGNVVEVDDESGPVRVAGGANPDAVRPDPRVQAKVTDPVQAALDDLASNVIGNSEVALDGVRGSVRSMETNEGNLIADALLWQATQLAASFGVPAPDVALQNGGGIRNDNVIPAGPITELNTFEMVPFPNFVSVVPDISRDQFKEILENAVSRTQPDDEPGGSGRFAQIAGFRYEWDPTGTAQSLNEDGTVATAGTRVQHVELDDGTVVVDDGAVVAGDAIAIATIDFLARGGDEYPYRGAPFTTLGVTYQLAVADYIVSALAGAISAADYPEGGEGRIVER